MIHFALCDDEASELTYLSSLIAAWAEQHGNQAVISTFPSAEAFLFEYDVHKDYDILLLDIEMKEMNGVELAKQIRLADTTVQIIFITGYPDFIAEGYEVAALHYLMKPVQPEKFAEVLNRACENLQRKPERLSFSSDGQTLLINKDSIIYAEACAHYVLLYTTQGDYKFRIGIQDLEQKLGDGFFRCSRSFLVSLDRITKLSKSEVMLGNAGPFPLGRGRFETMNLEILRRFHAK